MIPTLETERLVLRGARPEDFEPFAAHCASDRARFEFGRLSRDEAWREFASAVGLWPLKGYGAWSAEDRASGRYVGEIGLFQPPSYPEIEIGWTLMAEAEGRGFAFEGARAARDWAYGVLGLTTLVSYIDPRNNRSIRLAERLGARRDDAAARPEPADLVLRHPGPEACA